ncbi:MAG: ASCH domain-containing protein [Parachlamydiaceae bacterium]|nr:ASCH domain-containing protein [Parachlamydiaceae bacterium]
MAVYQIHCEEPWFSLIRNGKKPVEGRKNTHSYRRLKVGDKINFLNGTESFIAVVQEIRHYPSLDEYFQDVTLEKALPGVTSIEEGKNIYFQWSSEAKIKEFGFLGIFIKPQGIL